MKLITDTRKQKPFCFENFKDDQVTTGDHSLPGFNDQVEREQKSLGSHWLPEMERARKEDADRKPKMIEV
jgi:hypothetical protein